MREVPGSNRGWDKLRFGKFGGRGPRGLAARSQQHEARSTKHEARSSQPYGRELLCHNFVSFALGCAETFRPPDIGGSRILSGLTRVHHPTLAGLPTMGVVHDYMLCTGVHFARACEAHLGAVPGAVGTLRFGLVGRWRRACGIVRRHASEKNEPRGCFTWRWPAHSNPYSCDPHIGIRQRNVTRTHPSLAWHDRG